MKVSALPNVNEASRLVPGRRPNKPSHEARRFVHVAASAVLAFLSHLAPAADTTRPAKAYRDWTLVHDGDVVLFRFNV